MIKNFNVGILFILFCTLSVLPYENEYVIFTLMYINQELVIIPVVLIRDKELINPPEIYFGRLNLECVSFANKYYNLGQTYYKANSGIPYEVVSVNEEYDSRNYFIPELCIQPFYIKAYYLGNGLPSYSLITNSMTLAYQCTSKKNISKKQKTLLIKKIQEKILPGSLEIENAIETEFNKNNKLFLLWVNQKLENKFRKYLLFIEKYKNNYNVILVDSLVTMGNSYITFTKKMLLDVIDIDFDKNNEFVFYYVDDKNVYGFQIYKKYDDNMVLCYESKYGCY
ncbi:MAG: hypothetical protein QXU40_00885 [Candidatus Pacearchaeota archaeon]